MYKRVLVAEVDPSTHRVRGTFPDRGDVPSPWLDVLTRGAHAWKDFGLPRVGDQVAVILDEREESGCVLGALFSEPDPVPAAVTERKRVIVADDGMRASYDPETHSLELALPMGSTLAVTFGDGAEIAYDSSSHTMAVTVPSEGKLNLCGDASPVALATKTQTQLDAIQQALDTHIHQAGALVAPAGGGPVSGVSGTASSGYSPQDVGSARVNSA